MVLYESAENDASHVSCSPLSMQLCRPDTLVVDPHFAHILTALAAARVDVDEVEVKSGEAGSWGYAPLAHVHGPRACRRFASSPDCD